jgi:hypothetical protein
MCPGGTVVAAASEPGHVVTNGMSQYSRNERNANAGIVVGITPDDYRGIRCKVLPSSAIGSNARSVQGAKIISRPVNGSEISSPGAVGDGGSSGAFLYPWRSHD